MNSKLPSPADLENLMQNLDVRFVSLSECLVTRGFVLHMGGNKAPGLHYNLLGRGRMFLENAIEIDLEPHTLIVVPANSPFRIEVPFVESEPKPLKIIDGRTEVVERDGIRRYVAGPGRPDLILICGFFTASYGSSADLFAGLGGPLVEQFDEAEHLDEKLKLALAELVSEEVGAGAMSAALLKQVILLLLRRSLRSMDLWLERFAILSDAQVARALADMVANPGGAHTVQSLAASACMSRSTFMSRFTALVGEPPMAVLRGLRMRQAAQQLRAKDFTVEQVAVNAGYSNRSSFIRTFRKAFGCEPTEFRDSPPK